MPLFTHESFIHSFTKLLLIMISSLTLTSFFHLTGFKWDNKCQGASYYRGAVSIYKQLSSL